LRKTTLLVSAGALVACGAAAGWLAPAWVSSARAATAEAAVAPASQSDSGPIPLGYAPNYTAIVAQNRAAVVTITSKSVEHPFGSGQGQGPFGPNSPFGNDPFFRFFRGMPNMPNNVPVQSLGSGFIVRADGVILTNAHVVRHAQHVTVTLENNREYAAKVIGLDVPTDIAVLKIDARNLPTVRLGNSDNVQVGNYVLAVGAPFELKETATAGIVSAIARMLPGDDSYVPFIQTDVAVNPGNSGGPLFNEHGAVIGINSQIYSTTGGFEGVSFAVPINVAARVEQQILAHGKVEHARLGVEVQDLNQALAGSFHLSTSGGALVSKVEPDSAAQRAGIKPGDVILKIDGRAVSGSQSLAAAVGLSNPGTRATLEIWRNGKPLTLHMTLGSATTSTAVAANNEHLPGKAQNRLGLTVRPLTAAERAEAGVPSGLLVENATGPAADAGIQPGDIVLSADGTPVDSVGQLRLIVSHHKSAIALLVQHGNQRIFFPVHLG
ncbi:MAG: Do family serine endopeptidase, partial [Steroidobacteraceae bacterium]